MKKTLFILAALALFGCGNKDSGSAPASGATGTASQTPTAAATVTAAATATAAAAPDASAYRGLKPGDVVAGYIKDPKDEAQCAVVGVEPGKKAELTEDKMKEIAKMVKGELTTTCPTENIVGACSGFGIATQYYGPKYTKETAKKDCKSGKWTD